MNKKGVKTKIRLVIFWFVLIFSFLTLAIAIHLRANGWRINFQTWQLIKTGMILLDGTPKNAETNLNGKIYSQTLPTRISELLPGRYEISLTAPRYEPWYQTVYVKGGKANLYQSVILFLQNPTEAAMPADYTVENLKIDFQSQGQGLEISNSEIYWQDKMITRFSQNIAGAVFYPDKAHIVFQQNDEIRVIDLDGTNNRGLLKLSAATPTSFCIKNSGRTIYYLDQDHILAKNIL